MSTRWTWIFALLYVLARAQGGIMRIQTDFSERTDQVQLEPRGTSVTFRVKAKNDATLSLFNSWTIPTLAYELVIGGWSNTRSVIRKFKQGFEYGDADTEDILDSNAFRDFWARWENGTIELGRGIKVDRDRFLSWKDWSPRAIAMVAISNGFRSDGIWEIPLRAVKSMKIKTKNSKSYDRVWFSTTSVNKFSFSVKACRDVYVALSQEFGKKQKQKYEVAIGHMDNMHSALRASIQPPNETEVSTPYILSCRDYRSFWISWRQGVVQVGKGTKIGDQVFLQHTSSDHNIIKAVAISTGDGASGQWALLNPTVCFKGKWGLHCNSTCSRGCENVCDGETGTCQCEDGRFGTHCNNSCSSNCVDPRSCDKLHGHCLCKPGFQTPTCASVCEKSTFGQNCTQSCSSGCRRGECDNINGTCACLDHHYRANCTGLCGKGCSLKSCNKETGYCTCKPGWQSPMCIDECPTGYWGAGCTDTCPENCANRKNCSKTDGACFCQPGFRGVTCSQFCEEGKFGFNCESICHCKGGHDDCRQVNGTCKSGQCVEGREGVACQKLTSPKSFSSLSIAIGIGITAVILVILVMVLAVLFLKKRRRRNDLAKSENELTLDAMPTVSSTQSSSKENTRQILSDMVNYENLGIRVYEFPDYFREKKQAENGFQEEFESLSTGLSAPCEVGSTAEAFIKNRFRNIIAYDHTRVYIEGDTPLSQYINANFISGFRAPKAFIAAQGPVKETVADFIQMLWEQKVPLVVMVTNLTENGKAKCYQYWPAQTSTGRINHRGIFMKKLKEETFPHFIIRHLELEKENAKQPLTQIQYISWPDHGVPESPAAFLEFHQKAKQMYRPDIGPTLVHCSAGVGRTGTFLAVDYVLDQAKHEGIISIGDCVKLMRKDRVNMVQSLDQYVFIHESVLEALHCGKTVHDAVSFDGLTSSVNKQELITQYEVLEMMKPVVSNANMSSAKCKENRTKNRSQDVVPNSKWRPLLKANATVTSDYINAVFVHGYQKKHAFIATQSPLPGTVVDIWRLLQGYQCSTIIALNDTGFEETCPNYWERDEGDISPFSVDTMEETESNGYIRRHLQFMYKDEEKTVMQFQIKAWAPGTLPLAATLLSLYGEVKAWQQESGDSRIIVHCLYGAAETGLYLCLCHVCDKIEREQEVDVFHAVQKIRTSQPLFIPNQEQYEWLHQAAYEYISSFSMYSNFK